MATVRSATASANAPASGHGFAGSKKTAYGKYAYTTAGPLGGDTIVMCRLPCLLYTSDAATIYSV